ncbi:MAG: beta-ketoacyl-[acyl-carrier-protein] synthase family protein [Alicyclobacillaceae bacterium]|nr:beta-ketoacyl-[acyl-carrier-protein] synthase family protein [Alicyclobacillaceae bacterium]
MGEHVRIAVTGYGAVTPYGVGVSVFWDSIVAGRSAVRPMSDPELSTWSPVAAEAIDFDPSEHLARKLLNDTDRFTQMALVAATEAFADAGLTDAGGRRLLPDLPGEGVGIALGSAFGGIQSFNAAAAKLTAGAGRVSPRLVPKSIPNAAAAAIAMQYGIQGPVVTYATACASSANAVGEAAGWLRAGMVDVVLAGGAECLFAPAVLAGLRASGALATSGPGDPSTWSRPFDVDRSGMVMGEGAAFVVLERLDQALARGARVRAELAGYGTSNDAYHETSPHPEGRGAVLAMRRALRDAGIGPADVDYINAHATATPAGDRAEALALAELFGEHLARIPVSSIKGAVGHMLGTAGVIESIACIRALETGWLPPTLHCDKPDPLAPPDLVPHRARRQAIRRALSNSFGFGGQNGVLVWQAI